MKNTATMFLGTICFLFVTAFSIRGEDLPAGTQSIAFTDLNSKVRIIGRLGLPLGDVVRLSGEVYESRMKIHSNDITLKVLSINGKEIEEDQPRIVLRPDSSSWYGTGIADKYLHFQKRNESDDADEPIDPFGPPAEFHPQTGTILECVGYETGGFVGRPRAIYGDGLPTTETPDFHFRVFFYAAKVRVVTAPKVTTKLEGAAPEQPATGVSPR